MNLNADQSTKWIKKIHMYLGLVNFTILFIFGLVGISASFLPPPSEQDRAEPEAPDWRTQLWALYIEVSIWSLILMASSGIYLWLTSRPKLRWAQLSFAAGIISFIALWTLSR